MNSQNENTLVCPTFSSYTTDRLVEIATRVSDDFKKIINQEENDDELFEFAPSSTQQDFDSSVVHKSSVFPVFNRDLVQADKNIQNRISTSSSDESDSESEAPGSCVWRRKSIGSPSATNCKKSKSTGSVLFKHFKICDLLRRSSSDGKQTYLFSSKIDRSTNKIDYRQSPRHSAELTGKGKASPASSPHEMFYIQNRSIKEGDKRKSYLPYRQDLIGFFSVLGRASRT